MIIKDILVTFLIFSLLIGCLFAFGMYWAAKYASMSSIPVGQNTTTSTNVTTTTTEFYPTSDIYAVPTGDGNVEEITTMQNMPDRDKKRN